MCYAGRIVRARSVLNPQATTLRELDKVARIFQIVRI
jgi:hypothetical protein